MIREGLNEEPAVLSLKDRRQRYRQEMIDAILATARELMREEGAGALNLNEVARRLGMSPQALAKYFSSKAALYDALFVLGHRLFQEAEDEIWRTTRPDWERVRQWFEVRLELAEANPDLYSLIWQRSMPGFKPSDAGLESIRLMLAGARREIGEVIETERLETGMPPERVVDILLAARHGIVAEHMGKVDMLPSGSDRFRGLVPDVLEAFKKAWAPAQAGDGSSSNSESKGNGKNTPAHRPANE